MQNLSSHGPSNFLSIIAYPSLLCSLHFTSFPQIYQAYSLTWFTTEYLATNSTMTYYQFDNYRWSEWISEWIPPYPTLSPIIPRPYFPPKNTELFIPPPKEGHFCLSHFPCHCIWSASFLNRHPPFIQIPIKLPSPWSNIVPRMKLCLDSFPHKIRCCFYGSTILRLLKTWFVP